MQSRGALLQAWARARAALHGWKGARTAGGAGAREGRAGCQPEHRRRGARWARLRAWAQHNEGSRVRARHGGRAWGARAVCQLGRGRRGRAGDARSRAGARHNGGSAREGRARQTRARARGLLAWPRAWRACARACARAPLHKGASAARREQKCDARVTLPASWGVRWKAARGQGTRACSSGPPAGVGRAAWARLGVRARATRTAALARAGRARRRRRRRRAAPGTRRARWCSPRVRTRAAARLGGSRAAGGAGTARRGRRTRPGG